jgi:hypothetical protein
MGATMYRDVKNGQLRLKDQALKLGAHPECLRGRESSCQSCRLIMDNLIDRVSHPGGSTTPRTDRRG